MKFWELVSPGDQSRHWEDALRDSGFCLKLWSQPLCYEVFPEMVCQLYKVATFVQICIYHISVCVCAGVLHSLCVCWCFAWLVHVFFQALLVNPNDIQWCLVLSKVTVKDCGIKQFGTGSIWSLFVPPQFYTVEPRWWSKSVSILDG